MLTWEKYLMKSQLTVRWFRLDAVTVRFVHIQIFKVSQCECKMNVMAGLEAAARHV